MSQQTGSNAIRLAQPGAGQTVTIPIDADNMRLSLGFTPDPNAVAKNGQNLEFTFEDGGKIVLDGYYDHFTNKTLPVMVTEGGDELPGEDFLASLNEDLLTAAGPGAGGNTGSGGAGEYADDPGALIDGIGRLGSLGTIYWGNASEVPEDSRGLEMAGGTGSFSVTTEDPLGTGVIFAGVFEDARPWQNLPASQGGNTFQPAVLQFTFTGTGRTVCYNVTFTGFHEGSQVFFNGEWHTVGSDTQPIEIPYDQLQAGTVLIVPPADSDADMNITSTIEIGIPGQPTVTVGGPSGTIIVDAVADKPVIIGAEVTEVVIDGSMEVGESQSGGNAVQGFEDGWSKDDVHKSDAAEVNSDNVTLTAKFETTIQFGDYGSADGSELHYALLEVPSNDFGTWTPVVTSPASGVSLVVDANGDPVLLTIWYAEDGTILGEGPDAPAGWNPESGYSKEFYQFSVDNAHLESVNGELELKLDFVSDDAGIVNDTVIELEAIGKAQETVQPGGSEQELDWSNNVSYTPANEQGGDNPKLVIDTVDSQLTVKVGWMSEGGQADKNNPGGYTATPGGMQDPDGSGGDAGSIAGVEGGSTLVNRVPIQISLGEKTGATGDPAIGEASDEVISSIELDLSAHGGELTVAGISYDVTTNTTYFDGASGLKIVVDGGKVTISAIDPADNLGRGVDLEYKPSLGSDFSHDDMANSIGYKVTVEHPDTGSSAVISGGGTIVVDAVADQPIHASVEDYYDGTHSAAAPGGTASIKGSVTFPDTSAEGNEEHFIVLNVSKALADGWAAKGTVLSQEQVYDILEGIGGSGKMDLDGSGLLNPTSGQADAGEYMLFRIESDGNGGYQAVGVDANGDPVSGMGPFPVTVGAGGEFEYELPALVAPDPVDTEGSAPVWSKPIAVVNDPNPGNEPGKEYDYDNNIASGESKGTTVHFDKVTVRLAVGLTMQEDAQGQQHQDAAGKGGAIDNAATGAQNKTYVDHEGTTYATKAAFDTAYPNGLPISMKLVEAADGTDSTGTTDKVTKITFTDIPDAATEGTIYYNGVAITEADLPFTVNNPTMSGNDVTGFTFKPVDNYSGTPDIGIKAEIESTTSGHTRGEEGAVHVHDDGNGNIEMKDPADQDFNGYVHVESVADLADAELDVAREYLTDANGQLILDRFGNPQLILNNQGEGGVDANGWYVTEHGGESQTYTVTATIDLAFGDTDGSETGTILIAVEQGVKIVDPAGDGTTFLEPNNGYWEIDLGIIDADSNGKLDLTVVVDKSVKDSAELKAYVKTEEDADKNNNPNNETANDTAIREVQTDLKVPTLESDFNVKVGWSYEGNDGAKHGGPVGTPEVGTDAAAGQYGAVIKVDFTDRNGEALDSGDIFFTFDPAAGDFYYNGTTYPTITGPNGETMIKINYAQASDGKLTFLPKPGYGDDDIKLQYEVKITDAAEDVTFVVKGETTVVIDAVADRAEITATGTEGNQADGSVTISVKAAFPDTDGSEKHYILVEARGEWTCDGSEKVTLFVDGNGKPLPPSGYNEVTGEYEFDYPPGTPTMDFFQVDVTGTTPGPDGYPVTITPPASGAEDLKGLVVGTKAEEKDLSGHEHNYQNNVATDVEKIDVNVMDSSAKVSVGSTYEDHRPNQHTGNQAEDANSGKISVVIGKDTGSGHQGGAGGEYLDPDGDVVITFPYSGDGADGDGVPGSFTYQGINGPVTVEFGDTGPNGTYVSDGQGGYTVTIPAGNIAGSGNNLSQVDIRYNPPSNDDSDLTGVNIKVPVVSGGTGFKDTLETGDFNVVVDAVADLPVSGKGQVTEIDGNDPSSGREASWGDTVEIKVSGEFKDYKDGSEKHYLVIEARDGWSCDNADGVVVINGVTYFYKEVDNADLQADGKSDFTFEMTAPVNKAAAGADGNTIMNDGDVVLKTGSVAVEGDISKNSQSSSPHTNASPKDTVSFGGFETSGADKNEITTDNNVAIKTENTEVPFNVINEGKAGSSSGAYEDHAPGKNEHSFAEAANDGKITIALNDPSGKDKIVADGDNVLTFSFPAGKTPGTFTVDGVADPIEPTYNDVTGKWEVKIPEEAVSSDGRTVEITYNPPAFDNTDLTNVEYSLDAASTNSSATGTVTGAVNTGNTDAGKGTLIVDSVADKPRTDALVEAGTNPDGSYKPGSVNYGEKADGSNDPAEAAKPGDTVEVAVSVTFRDVEEGGESHYIVVKNSQWTNIGIDGLNNVTPSGMPGGYTYIDVNDLIKAAIADRGTAALPHEYEDLANGIKVTLSEDPHAPGHIVAKVDAVLEIDVPTNPTLDANGSGSIKLEVGGVAVDRDTDKGLDPDNDVAWDWKDTPVKIDTITSKPSISMENDHIYENLTPNAHGAQQGDPKYVNAGDGEPATMKFTGLVSGETAEVALRFAAANEDGTAVDFSGGKVMVRDANGNYLEDANGDPIEYPLVSDGNGGYTTDPALTLTGDNTIEFYPGTNYSDRDISVDYDVTVTDDATGAQHDWTTKEKPTDGSADPDTTYDQDKGGIAVDAVAQAPDVVAVDGAYGQDAQGNDLTAFPNGKASIGIDVNLNFEDYTDSSEIHYLLVEAQPGFVITTVTIEGPGGQTWILDVKAEWNLDGTPYVRYEIPNDILEACGGDLKATVTMNTPAGVSGNHSFKVGGMSQEDPNGLDAEDTRLNNQAVKVDETEIKFQGLGKIELNDAIGVYEGDAPNANVGDYSQVGGAEILVNLPGAPNVVSDITLASNHGTVYVFPDSMSPSDILALLQAGGSALAAYDANGRTYGPEIGNSKVIYIAAETDGTDDAVRINGTVTNPNTGQSASSSDTTSVIVDSVAQQPVVDDATDDKNGNYSVTVTFKDMDDSEDHFVLVEAKPGATLVTADGSNGPWEMYYHVGSDGKMTAYYKVPVDASDVKDGSYELEFTYSGGGEFKYGAMGEEMPTDSELQFHNNVAVTEDGKMGENPGGGGKLPDPEWIPPGSGHKCPVPEGTVRNNGAYENATPNANIGDLTENGDAILNFEYIVWYHHNNTPPPPGQDPAGSWCTPKYETPDEVSVTFDPETCAVMYNGEPIFETDTDNAPPLWTVEDNGDGTFTVTFNDYDNGSNTVALRPGDYSSAYDNPSSYDPNNPSLYDNNSDKDIDFEWSMKGPASEHHNGGNEVELTGNGTVVVDAVAQGIVDGSLDHDDGGHIYGATDGHHTNTVRLEGEVIDTDGSESCFFLIEAVPGVSVTGAETIYIGGTMYYKVPANVDVNGNATFDAEIVTSREALENGALKGTLNSDGTTTYELKYGAMTEEQLNQATTGGELTFNNNMSYDTSGTMEITVSYVNSDVKVRASDTYENDATSGAIAVAITLDSNDNLDEFSITYDPQAGEIVYTVNGVTYSANGEPGANFDDIFGPGKWAIEPAPGGKATLVLTNPDPDVIDSGLSFSTEGNYSSTDTSISWQAKVSDTASGDTKTFGDSQKIVIDAVAQAPEVDNVALVSDTGNESAVSGGSASVEMTLTFEDVGTGEAHYAVLANDGVWTCGSVVVTYDDGTGTMVTETVTPTLMYDKSGNPYYGVAIKDEWLDDDGSVKVEFQVTAPETSKDASYQLKAGGISVESYTQPDGELTLKNNWDENLETVTVKVGVVETTGVQMNIDNTNEDVASQMQFSLTDGNNDSIQTVTITSLPAGCQIGTMVNGVFVALADQSIPMTLNGATAQGGGYYFMGPENKHGSYNVGYQVTVQDDASGATKTFPENGSLTEGVYVTAVADKPVGVDVLPEGAGEDVTYAGGNEAAAPGGKVSFQVSATFPDHDGSESHYVLVEAKAGWTSSYVKETINGVTYFRVPVTGGYDADGKATVTVNLNAPSNASADERVDLKVGAMARENSNGSVAYTSEGEMDTVSVDIAAVQANAGNTTISGTATVEDATGTAGSQLTFGLDNGTADNESITAIQISNLNGGTIYDSVTGKAIASGYLDVTKALNGDYYYVPKANASGDIEIKFNITAKDAASGAQKTYTDSTTVSVAPVTDTPESITDSNGGVTVNSGHTASVTVNLSADFKDYDGSETHFFLVKLPAGASYNGTLASDEMLARAGMTGPAYIVTVSGTGNNADLKLTLSGDYDPNKIIYKAGSYENNLPDSDPDKYKFSGEGSHTVNADGDAFNKAPTLSSPTSNLNTLRGDEASGKVVMSDADGDTVTVTKVIDHQGTEHSVQDGFISVEGQYGTLKIDVATGEYTYTLRNGVTVPQGASESFSVIGMDNYGGTALAGTGTIKITFSEANQAPTATTVYGESGGGSETELQNVTGAFVVTDPDGDATFITGIQGGSGNATGPWELQGQYGKLILDADGNYTYVRTDEFATGRDEFTVNFKDEFGATGTGKIVIDAKGVNHAPVAFNESQFYDDASASAVTGYLIGSGKSMDSDGDTVKIESITYNGQVILLSTLGMDGNYYVFEADDFTLKVSEAGGYMFIPKEGVELGDSHSIGYTVTDGSLTGTGEMFFGKGEAADFPEAPNTIIGTAGDDTLAGTDGNDHIHGLAGNDTIHGGAGDDVIYGGSGNDTLYGDSGNDILFGGTGDDVIYGGTGDDVIRGGLGNDVLWGGDGSDSFVWQVEDIASDGLDKIMDFAYGDDKLIFDDALTIDGIFDLGTNTLTLDVAVSDTVSQQVEVVFENTNDYQSFVAEYSAAADAQAQQEAVARLIENITGN